MTVTHLGDNSDKNNINIALISAKFEIIGHMASIFKNLYLRGLTDKNYWIYKFFFIHLSEVVF